MTKREAAVVSAFTGVLVGDFGAMHEYVEEIMGRPVWTHEMGDAETFAKIKEAARADFLQLCADVTP